MSPVLHVNPELVVQVRALTDVLQLGIAKAAGAALEAVAFASTVFAAIDDRPDSGTLAHPGAVAGPVDTGTCPAVDPVEFSN